MGFLPAPSGREEMASVTATVGVWYERDGYDTSGKRAGGQASRRRTVSRMLVEHGRGRCPLLRGAHERAV